MSGRGVERGVWDLGRVLTLQVLDDSSETVAMGSDEHPLALFDLRDDLLVPEGQSASNGVLQALTRRQLVLSQVGVAPVLWHRAQKKTRIQNLNQNNEQGSNNQPKQSLNFSNPQIP